MILTDHVRNICSLELFLLPNTRVDIFYQCKVSHNENLEVHST